MPTNTQTWWTAFSDLTERTELLHMLNVGPVFSTPETTSRDVVRKSQLHTEAVFCRLGWVSVCFFDFLDHVDHAGLTVESDIETVAVEFDCHGYLHWLV